MARETVDCTECHRIMLPRVPGFRPAGRLRRRVAAITPKGVGLGILIGWALRAVLG